MSEKWHLEGGEVFDSERRGVALISTTYLAKGAGPLIASAPDFYHAATTGEQLNLPDFLEWIAARLIRFGDSPNVDFVVTLRDRAKLLRAAIAKAENRP